MGKKLPGGFAKIFSLSPPARHAAVFPSTPMPRRPGPPPRRRACPAVPGPALAYFRHPQHPGTPHPCPSSTGGDRTRTARAHLHAPRQDRHCHRLVLPPLSPLSAIKRAPQWKKGALHHHTRATAPALSSSSPFFFLGTENHGHHR